MNPMAHMPTTAIRSVSYRGFLVMSVVSFLLHLGGVFGFIVYQNYNYHPPIQIQTTIQTKLVRLGQNQPSLLPRLTAAAKPPSPTQALDNKASTVQQENHLNFAEALKKIPHTADKTYQDSKDRLNDIFKKRYQADDRGAKEEAIEKGDPRGSVSGTVSEFTLQTLGQQYATDIEARIRPNWNVPSVITEAERDKLSATVVFYISPQGKILRYEFEKKSGQSLYDNALLRAIELSNPLPVPPLELREQVMKDGFEITFKSSK